MARTCFFISRIGDVGSPEREFSDKLLHYIIEPVLEKCGYERPIRADHITQPGVITTQVFTRLWKDDLVIADLTGSNPNVFYELAVRHLRRKPFIHLIETGHKIPFDVAPNRTIQFGFDIEEAELAKSALEGMINRAGDDSATLQTPLSAAVDFAVEGTAEDPIQNGVAQILSIVQELRGRLDSHTLLDGETIWQDFTISPHVDDMYELNWGNKPVRFPSKEALLRQLEDLLIATRFKLVAETLADGAPVRVLNQPRAFAITRLSLPRRTITFTPPKTAEERSRN